MSIVHYFASINTFILSINITSTNKMKFLFLALPVLAHCGEIVWNGIINVSTTVDHFGQCMSTSRK